MRKNKKDILDEMKEVILSKMANHIKMARVRQGISQDKLAQMSGVHRATIIRIEGGKYSPGLHQLTEVCRALGVVMRLEMD